MLIPSRDVDVVDSQAYPDTVIEAVAVLLFLVGEPQKVKV